MTEMYSVQGVAGSGKSFSIRKFYSKFLSNGYTPSDIWVGSFTNSHASDLSKDIVKESIEWIESAQTIDQMDEREKAVKSSVSTLHSLSFSNVVEDYNICMSGSYEKNAIPYRAFFDSINVEFKNRSQDTGIMDDIPLGNKIIKIESWLQNDGRTLSVKNISECPVELDVPDYKVKDIIESWRKFKQMNMLVEHHDYIKMGIMDAFVPQVDIIIVDESQDMTNLEQSLIRYWIEYGNLDYVVIVGDRNQSIYGFKPSNTTLLDMDFDHEIHLSKSRRFSSKISKVARKIYPPSDIKSHGDVETDGFVVRDKVDVPSDLHSLIRHICDKMDIESVMLLGRRNKDVEKMIRMMSKQGIPHHHMSGQESWGFPDELKYLSKELESVDGESTKRICAQTDDEWLDFLNEAIGEVPELKQPFIDMGEFDLDESKDIISRHNPFSWSPSQLKCFDQYCGSSEQWDDLSISIGTIHSSKGRQADLVVIPTGYPSGLKRVYEKDLDFQQEEDRVFHVGATRPRRGLVFLDGIVSGVISPTLEGNIPSLLEAKASKVIQ